MSIWEDDNYVPDSKDRRIEELTAKVLKLHELNVRLLVHLEDILDDDNFEKINPDIWNDVSMFVARSDLKKKV